MGNKLRNLDHNVKYVSSRRSVAGKINATKRKDFLPGKMKNGTTIKSNKSSPAEKRKRYHERIFSYFETSDLESIQYDRVSDSLLDISDNYSTNSEIALYCDILRYLESCVVLQLDALPLDSKKILLFLNERAKMGCKTSTIKRNFSSLCSWSVLLYQEDPRYNSEFRDVFKNLPYTKEVKNGDDAYFTLDDLFNLIEGLDLNVPRDCQDYLLLLIGFETLLLPSDLIRLDWENIVSQSDGTTLLTLSRSPSNDSTESIFQLSIPCGIALRRWQHLSQKETGALFRGIYSNLSLSERLSSRGVSRSFKRISSKLGLKESAYSGKSARRGAVSFLIEAGVCLHTIQKAAQLKSTVSLKPCNIIEQINTAGSITLVMKEASNIN